MKTTSYHNTNIHYTTIGKGEAIVLLHGYLEAKEIWQSFTTELHHFCVIEIDLPGHGQSACLEKQTIENMAAAVHAVIKGENLKKVHLVGHSMGGYVALAFLELYPEYLSSICLMHSHPFADSEMAIKKRNREITLVKQGKSKLLATQNIPNAFATKRLSELKETIAKAQDIAIATPDNGIVACLKAMRDRKDRSEIWKKTSVPCLLVFGELDNYIQEELLHRIEMPKNSSIFRLENSGHQGFLEQKKETAKGLLNFIKSTH